MADLAASDVTYTVHRPRRAIVGHGYTNYMSLAFGDGAKTYPSGGVPLTKAKLGCPNDVQDIEFIDSGNANGFVYKIDKANLKVRIYQGDNDNVADAPLIELAGGSATPAAATIIVRAVGY